MANHKSSWTTTLFGAELLPNSKDAAVKKSTNDILKDKKVVGIYFSAHWCLPCRGFTPELAKFYSDFVASRGSGELEIVFVSSDKDASSFSDYFKEMPWTALPFDARDKKADLSRRFDVQGIPTLVFLNGDDGSLITMNGRAAVKSDPKGLKFPFYSDATEGSMKEPTTSFSRLIRSQIFWTSVAFALVVRALTQSGFFTNLEMKPAANKSHTKFDDFYPFYLTQHQNPTSRILHVVGTTIFFYFCLLDPSLLVSLGVAVYTGMGLCELTRHINHGGIEAAVMIFILQINSFIATKSVKKGLGLMVVAYGFAWVGHFFFEKNTPATFIYPSYSLLGDFRMWFETITGKMPLYQEGSSK